jgi:perosamine synthetase
LNRFYQEKFGLQPGLCPVAEAAYARILSLPIYPALSDQHVDVVIAAVAQASHTIVGAGR